MDKSQLFLTVLITILATDLANLLCAIAADQSDDSISPSKSAFISSVLSFIALFWLGIALLGGAK